MRFTNALIPTSPANPVPAGKEIAAGIVRSRMQYRADALAAFFNI
jgi:hypothetical protein